MILYPHTTAYQTILLVGGQNGYVLYTVDAVVPIVIVSATTDAYNVPPTLTDTYSVETVQVDALLVPSTPEDTYSL